MIQPVTVLDVVRVVAEQRPGRRVTASERAKRGEFTEGRPPLSRWHPDWVGRFKDPGG